MGGADYSQVGGAALQIATVLHACMQVQKLLDLMGMAKYQKTFLEAEIDGSILVQCDDKILLEVKP